MISSALLAERTSRDIVKRRDWTHAALDDLFEGARSVLAGRGIALEPASAEFEGAYDIRTTGPASMSGPGLRAMCDESVSILNSAIEAGHRQRVLDENAYVIPGAASVLDRSGADLLLLAFAKSERWFAGQPWAHSSGGFILLALVDRTGRVVWMNTSSGIEGVDMTKPGALRRLVGELLDELPAPAP